VEKNKIFIWHELIPLSQFFLVLITSRLQFETKYDFEMALPHFIGG